MDQSVDHYHSPLSMCLIFTSSQIFPHRLHADRPGDYHWRTLCDKYVLTLINYSSLKAVTRRSCPALWLTISMPGFGPLLRGYCSFDVITLLAPHPGRPVPDNKWPQRGRSSTWPDAVVVRAAQCHPWTLVVFRYEGINLFIHYGSRF